MADTQPTYPLGTRYVDNMDAADPTPYTPERFDVIGEVERAPVGNAILRIGRTWPKPQPGWTQELHLVLTPDERDRLIADLTAQRPTPKVLIDGDATRLAWVWDGDEIGKGNVHDLAEFLQGCQDAGHPYPTAVYAPNVDGGLTPVPYTIATSDYDENDYATATVTVTLADGVTPSASWRVDGRA